MTFRSISTGRGFLPWLKAETKGKSGAYLIRDSGFFGGEIVYVGESHTGRLFQTITRHFQRWKGKTAGPTYPRSKVQVAIVRCPAKQAVDLQDNLIAEFRPKDNIANKPGFWSLT